MADITDFQLGQGETFKILVQLYNRELNSPLNITDYTFTGQLRENYTTTVVAAELNFDIISPATSGSLFMSMTPDQTLTLNQRQYVYDVNATYTNVIPITRRLLEGKFTIRPLVSR